MHGTLNLGRAANRDMIVRVIYGPSALEINSFNRKLTNVFRAAKIRGGRNKLIVVFVRTKLKCEIPIHGEAWKKEEENGKNEEGEYVMN